MNLSKIFKTKKHFASNQNRQGEQPIEYLPPVSSMVSNQSSDFIDLREIRLEGVQIIDVYQHSTHEIIKRAIPDAVQGIPISVAENELTAEYLLAKEKLNGDSAGKRKTLDEKIKAAEPKIGESKSAEYYEKKLEPHKKKALSEAKKQHFSKSSLKEKLRQKKERLAGIHARLQEILNSYNRLPPDKVFIIDNPIWVWTIIGSLALIEGYINLESFQKIGLGSTNLGALCIALFFAAIQGVSAELTGHYWCKEPKRLKSWGFSGTTIVVSLFICGVRLSMDGSLTLNIIYASLNFMVAGATGVIAYFHARNKEYFSLEKKKSKLSTEIDGLETQIKKDDEDYQHTCEAIEREAKIKADELAEKDSERLKKEIKQLETARQKLDEEEPKYLKQLEGVWQKTTNDYRRHYQTTQIGDDHLPYHKINGKASSSISNVIIVLIVALFGLGGCYNPPPEDTYIEILIDKTDTTYAQDINQIQAYVLNFVPYDTVNMRWGKTIITLSTIGETSTQNIQTVCLQPSESNWFERNEREHSKRLAIFKDSLRQELTLLTKPGTGMDKSYIHRNFYYRLLELNKVKGNRIILSWSDLIANDLNVNLYDYRDNPLRILEKRDSIIEVMTAHYPLPDSLKGVKLINVHNPSRLNDELHEACKRLFAYYWEKAKIQVEFKPNIPMQGIANQTTELAKK